MLTSSKCSLRETARILFDNMYGHQGPATLTYKTKQIPSIQNCTSWAKEKIPVLEQCTSRMEKKDNQIINDCYSSFRLRKCCRNREKLISVNSTRVLCVGKGQPWRLAVRVGVLENKECKTGWGNSIGGALQNEWLEQMLWGWDWQARDSKEANT